MARSTTTPPNAAQPDVQLRKFGNRAPMLVLLLLAGLAIEEGLRLLLTVDAAAQADPAGWYVLVLGLVLVGTTVSAERPKRTADTCEPHEEDVPGEVGAGQDGVEEIVAPLTPRRDMLVCLALVALYAVLLGTLGYVVAGVVVVLIFLRAVSRYGWLRCLAYTLAINVVFVALFELSGVVLPAGILEF